MKPNVIVLHTTEGSSFPSYDGGASAPNFTVKGTSVRQHYAANESSRALVNAKGGVETNTLNAVQIELVGTCAKGGPGLYWPNATDADMKGLVDLVKWLTTTYPGIPLVATSKPWLAYPASYGSKNKQRMTFAEWNGFKGICGHQHVPENDHGDPGNFPISRLIALVKSAGGSSSGSSSGSKIVALNSAVKPGATHAQVAELQQLLIKAGYGPIKGAVTKFYGEETQKAVARFHDRNPAYRSGLHDPRIGPKGFVALQKQAGRR
ncbi:peptidoglycan-binding protein [Streptomyces sp. R08]|uniref:Peptidoglycan-binding protein n=1 Tax=Streptomyces sp. R08 TaxID=3238624 RepID=A0AB39M2R0_9ACTN